MYRRSKPEVIQKPLAVLTEQRAAAKAIHLVIERSGLNSPPTFDAHQPRDLLMHLEGCEQVPDVPGLLVIRPPT